MRSRFQDLVQLELVRLLSRHPEFDVALITSRADEGQRISDLYPALEGVCDLAFVDHDDPALFSCDVVFLLNEVPFSGPRSTNKGKGH